MTSNGCHAVLSFKQVHCLFNRLCRLSTKETKKIFLPGPSNGGSQMDSLHSSTVMGKRGMSCLRITITYGGLLEVGGNSKDLKFVLISNVACLFYHCNGAAFWASLCKSQTTWFDGIYLQKAWYIIAWTSRFLIYYHKIQFTTDKITPELNPIWIILKSSFKICQHTHGYIRYNEVTELWYQI